MSAPQSGFVPTAAAVVGPWPAWVLVERLLVDDVEARLATVPEPHRQSVRAALAHLRQAAEAASGSAERQDEDDAASWGPSTELTTEEASQMLGLTPRQWCNLASLGAVKARKVGRSWLLDDTDARAYRARTGAA